MSRRYLLDTHVVLWWLHSDRKLGRRTRDVAGVNRALGVEGEGELGIGHGREQGLEVPAQ